MRSVPCSNADWGTCSHFYSVDLRTTPGCPWSKWLDQLRNIPPVQLETSGCVLSTMDMVVQRRDGPRWLRDDDDDELCVCSSNSWVRGSCMKTWVLSSASRATSARYLTTSSSSAKVRVSLNTSASDSYRLWNNLVFDFMPVIDLVKLAIFFEKHKHTHTPV